MVEVALHQPRIETRCAFVLLLLLGIPRTALSQNQPGRFVLSPFRDAIIECAVDAWTCFNVAPNGSNHGGAESVSGAWQPTLANNGTIVYGAVFTVDGSCVPGAQGICWPHVFVMNADGTNVRQITFVNGDPS